MSRIGVSVFVCVLYTNTLLNFFSVITQQTENIPIFIENLIKLKLFKNDY